MRVLLVVYDNDSYIHFFPMGIAALTAILEKHGYEVDIFFQDVEHLPDEALGTYIDENDFDVVGFSFIAGYYQYRKAIGISLAINQARKRPFYVLGGHGPSPEPGFFLRKLQADAVCMGEGEDTIIELLDALGSGRDLSGIKGLAYRNGNTVHVNPPRPVISDLDSLPFPAYHRFPMHYYRLLRSPHCTNRDFVIPMVTGRGCPYNCNFCYRMDAGYRKRSNESVCDEIELLIKDYGITYIAFSDELQMSSPSSMESFCKCLMKRKWKIRWSASGRLNYATPEVLRLMKKAGCVFVYYGIESFDDESLRLMNKNLTEREIVSGIEATIAAGISPGLNMLFGNIGDTRESLRKSVDFLLRYDDGTQLRTIRPVTPYPGTRLYKEAIDSGKLLDCEDFYENKHRNSDLLSVNFTSLDDDEYYEALYQANMTLLENYERNKMRAHKKMLDDLYYRKNAEFRGFRQS